MIRPRIPRNKLSLYILLIWIRSFSQASFIINIDEDDQECFDVRTPATQSYLSGDFDCWEEWGDRVRACRRIMAWVEEYPASLTDNAEVWRNHEDYSEGDFYFESKLNQRYRLCFLSESRDASQKSARREEEEEDDDDGEYRVNVGFSIRVHSASRTLPDEEIGPDAQKAVELLHLAEFAHDMWHNIGDHFDFLRNREAVHRQLAGQINDRVMGWTIIETVVVISMALGQVWYWKTFFEQRRFL